MNHHNDGLDTTTLRIVKNFMSNEFFPIFPLNPNHWSYMIGSFSCCCLLYFLSQLLSPRVSSKTYPALPYSDKIEWHSRVISTIHAIVAAQGGVRCVFFDPYLDREISYAQKPISQFYLSISVGYFAFDLSLMVFVAPQIATVGMISHHCLGGCSYLFSMMFRAAHYCTIIFSITEATTPFVNTLWFLTKLDLKQTRIYRTNGLLLWIAWIVFRLDLLPFLLHRLWRVRSFGSDRYPRGVKLFVAVALINMAVLNTYWFYRISLGLYRAFAPARKFRPADEETPFSTPTKWNCNHSNRNGRSLHAQCDRM